MCGCLVNLKVTIASSTCPVGKWGEAEAGNDLMAEISNKVQAFFKPKS